jgi:hypothetical protein
MEDFTLLYRFQVESTWSQVDSRWIIFGRELCQIMVKIHLESIWTLPGLHMDSSPKMTILVNR